MRHLRKIAKLGRNSGHRKALLVNMACSLIEHDQIETTVNRAKEVRRLVDRLITYGKKGGEHNRRLAIARIKDNTPSDKAHRKTCRRCRGCMYSSVCRSRCSRFQEESRRSGRSEAGSSCCRSESGSSC